MSESFVITIPGDPVAQKRPRFSRKLGRAFSVQHDVKDCMTWHFASQWGDRDPLDGPVELDMTFYIKIAASTSKKKATALLGQPCLKHADTDNFIKLACDSAEGVLFKNDSQVWAITAKKIWSDDPRTVMIVDTPHA